jgi:adenylate cyclase
VDPSVDGVYRTVTPCLPVHDGCLRDFASVLTGAAPAPGECGEPAIVPALRPLAGFARLSLAEVVALTEDAAGRQALRAFAGGRYVVVGLTDPTIGDFGSTARSAHEPLVALHANRVDALLAGVRVGPVPAAPLLVASLLVLVPLVLRVGRARLLLAGVPAAAVLAVAASAAAMRAGQWWAPPSPLALPLGLGLALAGAVSAWRYFLFNRMIEQAFGAYVSSDVLDWLRSTGGAALAPDAVETREVTVMFTDIAGYTRLSNSLDAGQVRASLRHYLERMVQVTRRHGGYIDKINGDGLVVLFGAPRVSAAHADGALACAREMQAAVGEMGPRWREMTGGDLAIRIGIATGSVFVGNLGGEGHVEYTAIGRTVNLAARLEGKSQAGGVLLAESTLRAVSAPPEGTWREVELKGYESEGPVRAWQVPPGPEA